VVPFVRPVKVAEVDGGDPVMFIEVCGEELTYGVTV
jgi:hypothetical protein